MTSAGTPDVDNDNAPGLSGTIQNRAGTNIVTADRRGVIVSAVSSNDIVTVGAAVAASGDAAVSLAGAVNVHTIRTEAHIDAGADINATNAGAGALQGVYVDAGRSLSEVVVGIGAAGSGGFAGAAGAAVPVVLGHTKAWVGNDGGFATDSHASGAAFGSVINANGDVEVHAVAQEKAIAVAVGVSVAQVGIAGSGAVFVMDTDTLAAISGDVKVAAGGNVLVGAQDDTRTYVIAGGVGVGVWGGGAGAIAVTVLTKETTAVIGGGAVVDADGTGSASIEVPTGEVTASGAPIFSAAGAGLHGVAVQARSSSRTCSRSARASAVASSSAWPARSGSRWWIPTPRPRSSAEPRSTRTTPRPQPAPVINVPAGTSSTCCRSTTRSAPASAASARASMWASHLGRAPWPRRPGHTKARHETTSMSMSLYGAT